MPRTSGGFGEVWLGTWGCEKVAIKVIKATAAADPKELMKVCDNSLTTFNTKLTSPQQLAKEVIVWGQLNHRNLLPLYGISTSFKVANDGYPNPCLVSPWMENGKLCVFVRKNPTFNRFNLASNPPPLHVTPLIPFSWWMYAMASFTCTRNTSSMGI